MRPYHGFLWVCAVVLLASAGNSAHAAWDNVFQTCCWNCRSRPATSYYAPAPVAPQAACCPQPQYVQRCYYQPVTSYQTRTYYEPVTTYRTSYYYEPVTSYRYSCYYDPCTCSYQQVATPTTSYKLRSQCCPVQSWVQRCAVVPVTTYRQSCCYEPVNPCSTQPGQAPVAPAVSEQSNYPPLASPGVTEQRSLSQPNGSEGKSSDRLSPTPLDQPMPGASGSSFRQLPPIRPQAPRPVPQAPAPAVRPDRIVSLPGAAGDIQGQVIRDDKSSRAITQLVFVSTAKTGARQVVAPDDAGRFSISLVSGEWLVYVNEADGKQAFHGRIDVRGNETRQLTVLGR